MNAILCDYCGEPITCRVGGYQVRALVTSSSGDGSTHYDLCNLTCLRSWVAYPPRDLLDLQQQVADTPSLLGR